MNYYFIKHRSPEGTMQSGLYKAKNADKAHKKWLKDFPKAQLIDFTLIESE